MKIIKIILGFLLLQYTIVAQDAVHNYGNIQIHDDGLVGFHMDVINNGAFNQNKGLVGFYSFDKALTISGGSNPIFYDFEVAVDNDLYIDNTVGIQNNANFIIGDIVTSRAASEVNINFLNDSFYTGESNFTKVDGYAATSNKSDFTFPIGHFDKIRPLRIESISPNDYAKSAYYYEDPNTPSVFGTSFSTFIKENEALAISEYEFWHLESMLPSKVTLTWDEESYAHLFGEDITDIKVVGWSVIDKIWVDLGNTNVEGDFINGSVTSEEFIPSDYEIITIGGNSDLLGVLDNIMLDNYYMTPNGDGINDFLEIEGLEGSPNNELQIYNRYGRLVFSMNGYSNQFTGISNVNGLVSKNTGLPSGIYFYIVKLNDLNYKHQGYLYLTTYQEN
ncbi:gliding motility-associated C-terminal domain-containing protein [Maribacter sp. SA7]|uniref:gliding motility-associated C-terminal domain-containing protein n=1 Tax=Maribacter zhoushanensis TaxID=3030012 RepID=UPI0023ED8FAD|nr:gliding motility-associated C-terminal domain-containing protein [Maribacter zhoushanensis]MDF4204930.1 gliding motility-associated C-terminal domain-containing protein [Maribacter zhoushanensis]